MRVIISGAGQVGQGIVAYLAAGYSDIVVIDTNLDDLHRLEESSDIQTIHGNACYPNVLAEAGAGAADLLVAVTPSDEMNIVTCQVAHTLFNVPLKIAHLRESSYLDSKNKGLFGPAGIPIDVVISPEKEVAHAIRRSMQVPGAIELLRFSGNALVASTQCASKSMLVNTPISHFSAIFPDIDISIMGIIRDERLIIPCQTDVIEPLDYVYFAVSQEQIHRAMVAFGHEEKPLTDILILGGGNIGAYLTRYLQQAYDDISIRLVEYHPQRSRELAHLFPKALVLNGNALDATILCEANIGAAQVVVAVTNDNEVNLLASLMAKKLSQARTISVVNNPSLSSLVTPLGIDAVINPRNITVSSILRHIRKGNTRSARTLMDGQGELIEVDITNQSAMCGEIVGNVTIPKHLIIGLIIRQGVPLFPTAKDSIQPGDSLIILVSKDAINEVDKFSGANGSFK